MSTKDGASEHVRRGDILLVAVGDAKHLVDLEDRASLEAVAEGAGFSARNVQVPLLGDEHLELLAAPVGDGEPTLGGEPADFAGNHLLRQDYLDDGTGYEDDEVAWVCEATGDVGGQLEGHVGEVRLGVECRCSVKGAMSACPSPYSRRRIYPRPLVGHASS